MTENEFLMLLLTHPHIRYDFMKLSIADFRLAHEEVELSETELECIRCAIVESHMSVDHSIIHIAKHTTNDATVEMSIPRSMSESMGTAEIVHPSTRAAVPATIDVSIKSPMHLHLTQDVG